MADTIIVTDDHTFFAVHTHRLLAASTNEFGGLLSPNSERLADDSAISLIIPELSGIMTVVLCCAYGLSCDTYNPTLECIASAIKAMRKYGMSPHRFISRGRPLYDIILNHAPHYPIETYTLAGSENLEDLAVAASSYTLHVKLDHISDQAAAKMGALYLHRLHKLHARRVDALKNMLDDSIFPHIAKPHCSAEQRQVVNMAYNLATTQVFYNASPGQCVLYPSRRQLPCLYGVRD